MNKWKPKGIGIILSTMLLSALLSCMHVKTINPLLKDDDPCNCDEEVAKNPDCFKVYADVHLQGGDREVEGLRENITNNMNLLNLKSPSFKERTFYLGDVVDLANAQDKDSANKEIVRLRNAVGANYVRGNHEMDSFGAIGENRFTVYRGNILFIHGHQLRYQDDRIAYYESGRQEQFYKEVWDKARSTDEVFLEAAKEGKKHNCRVVVFGHTHPKLLDERSIDGVRIINVMKGSTYLFLPAD